MFRRFGSDVTIVDRGPHLLSREDPDTSRALEDVFQSEGIQLELQATVESRFRPVPPVIVHDGEIRQVIDIHFRREIRFDVGEGTLGLPGGQAPGLQLVHAQGIDPEVPRLRAEQCRGVAQTTPRRFAVGVEECHGLPDQIAYPNGSARDRT